jgi:hypothetical protein
VCLSPVATWFDVAKESEMNGRRQRTPEGRHRRLPSMNGKNYKGNTKLQKIKLEIDDLVTYIVNFLT